MDSQNKLFNVILGSLAAVLVIAILIFSVTFGINIALAPISGALKDVGALDARVASLEADLKALKEGGGGAKQAPAAEDYTKVYNIPAADSYVLGKKDARVTVVEFSDLQCPYCSRFHPLVNEIAKAFPNDVKVIFKNYPLGFHQHARPAAKAALAAGLQGKYYEMVNVLMMHNPDNVTEEDYRAFAKQKGMDPDKYMTDLQAYWNSRSQEEADSKKVEMPPKKPEFSAALYKELAGQIGLDVAQFEKDLKEKDVDFDKKIEADIALATKVDVRGTPTFFINGKKTKSRDIKGWTAEIQALLKK